MAEIKAWQWAAGIGGLAWFAIFWNAGTAQAAPGPTTDAPPDPTDIPTGGIVMDLTASDQVRQIAEAIAYAEGYYRGDGSINEGALPVRRNNPGDIKATGGAVTTYPTIADGWAALYHQIQLILDGKSHYYTPTMPITAFAAKYSAATGHELTNYAATVAQHLGLSVTDSLSQVA